MTEAPRSSRARDFATPRMPARLAALRFVLDCHATKEAAPVSRPDDAKGSKHDRARDIIPKRS
jgi:hypothetical protein